MRQVLRRSFTFSCLALAFLLAGCPPSSTSFSLTTAVSGGGTVVLNPPGGVYPAATTVQVTAVAAYGWQFQQWQGDASGAANPVNVAVDGPNAVTAVFTKLDLDDDSLTDAEEAALGTNPQDPDTDRDGVLDGAEVANGSDPLNGLDEGGQAAPADPQEVQVGSGETAVTVPTATFAVLTNRLTDALPGGPAAYSLFGGVGAYEAALGKALGASADAQGRVRLSLNRRSNTLLQLRNGTGNTLLYAYFPKHPALKLTSPSLNYLDCSAALIYSRPGLLDADPLVSAVLLHILRQLPETHHLADLIRQKIVANPAIFLNPDTEVAQAVSDGVAALLAVAGEGVKADKPTLKTEAEMGVYDLDGIDQDKVDVAATVEEGLGYFSLANTASRWVAFYVDPNVNGQPGAGGAFAGMAMPRPFALPSIRELVLDALRYNWGGKTWELFKGATEAERTTAIHDAVAAVTAHFGPTGSQFTAAVLGNDFLSSYSVGCSQGEDDNPSRFLLPAVLTAVSQILLPMVEVATDMSGAILANGNLAAVREAAPLSAELAQQFGPGILDVFDQACADDLAASDATETLLQIAGDLALDEKLAPYLAIQGPLSSPVIELAAADVVAGVFASQFAPATKAPAPQQNAGYIQQAYVSATAKIGKKDDYQIGDTVLNPAISYFSINLGALSTTTRFVTLNNLCGVWPPTQYLASESATFDDASWRPYSQSPGFELSTGNGTKTVYFKVRNANSESAQVSANIFLDEMYTHVPGETAVFEGIEFVWCPPGAFIMGSEDWEQDWEMTGYTSEARPRHLVTITRGFWIGKYEITQAQYIALGGVWQDFTFTGDPNLPADYMRINVTINTVLNQLNWPDPLFRLPTEAEWEYACRAGTTSRYYYGDDLALTPGVSPDSPNFGQYAWYAGNAGGQTHPVGTKLPNAWGIHDMMGNASEWVQDWWGDYATSAQIDPLGPYPEPFVDYPKRILRGGAYDLDPWQCRPAAREGTDTRYPPVSAGFRLVREEPFLTPSP